MVVHTPPRAATSIPVVDLSGSWSPDAAARRQVAWEVHKACRETGFFFVSGHRVPQALVDAQFGHMRRFFELPPEDKMALHMNRSPSRAGYEPVGEQTLDSRDEAVDRAPPDLKESYYVMPELPQEHPFVRQGLKSFGRNQWPPALPGFREQMLAYHAAMSGLAERLLSVLALSLELDEGHFRAFHDTPGATLRLIRYPPESQARVPRQLGAGAHTDWGGITLLAQDDSGGLEVRNVEGRWIDAKPVPGTFVINLGDLMERWTNGLYRSNMHRVRNNRTGRERFSVAFFYSPRPDARIEALPGCAGAGNPPRYAPCTTSEHLYEMYRRSFGLPA